MSAINEWFGYENAMYRYIARTYGEEELHAYFDYLAKTAYCDVTPQYRDGGLEAIRDRYIRNFRKDGDENSASADLADGVLTMQVHCPGYHNAPVGVHPDRKLGPFFCDCCRELNGDILKEAGYQLNIGMEQCGDCLWHIQKRMDGK